MLTIEKIESKECFSKLYNSDCSQRFILNGFLENKDELEIWETNQLKYNFYIKFLERMQIRYKNNIAEFHIVFPYEIIKYIILKAEAHNVYISRDFSNFVFKTYPELIFLEVCRLSSWQGFTGRFNEHNIEHFFNKMTSLTNPLDDRFSIYPTFTYSCGKGSNQGVWFEKLNNKKGEKNAVEDMYIDGKIGFIIYFKGKPSIIVGLQFRNNEVYINQIQSVKKDRGHYKIKGNWREFIINYIIDHFDVKNVYIISAYTASRIVISNYNDTSKLNKSSLLRSCLNSYNKPFENRRKTFRISTREGLFTYRVIK